MSDSSPRHPPLDTLPEPEPEAPAGRGGAEVAGADTVTTARGQTIEIELTRAQHTFARRVAESQATIPQLTLRAEVDLESRLAAHEHATASATAEQAAPATCTGEIVKACALALREHPRVNSTYRDGRVQMHSRVNIGVAVPVEGGGAGAPDASTEGTTAIAPTVFDADRLTVEETAREIDHLRVRALEGILSPPELSGATFTVFDLSAFGVDSFTATVPPGQTAILAIGSLRSRPVALDDGRLAVHRIATLTLSCDHRVLYGADAARFLTRIREPLEASAVL